MSPKIRKSEEAGPTLIMINKGPCWNMASSSSMDHLSYDNSSPGEHECTKMAIHPIVVETFHSGGVR